MWTARFGILGQDENRQKLDEITSSKRHLEIEILINEDDNEIRRNVASEKSINKYKPYFTGNNSLRPTEAVNRRKVVIVHGDGRMSRKQVIR